MIANRLVKNFKHISKIALREQVNCFRLYDRDIPEYPFIVDIYSDHAVVYDRGNEEIDQKKNFQVPHLFEALINELKFDPSKIFFKTRRPMKGVEQYQKLDQKAYKLHVCEKEAKFIVNLSDYLDTGLFLDHRPLRQMIFKSSQNKKILNLFSYTSSISVFAALGGGTVTSVDLSNTYLDWSKENFKLNDLDPNQHQFVKADVQKFLKEHHQTKWDIIIIDPPTFSNSKSFEGVFDIQEDHHQLLKDTIGQLKPNGEIYFSTNKRDFKLEPSLSSLFQITDLTDRSIPFDYRDKKIHKLFLLKLK